MQLPEIILVFVIELVAVIYPEQSGIHGWTGFSLYDLSRSPAAQYPWSDRER